MSNTVNDSAIKKLKLLFTVVDRQKGEFYLDVISQFEINCQMVIPGKGTANTELVDMLGLNPHKAVIFSVGDVKIRFEEGLAKIAEQAHSEIIKGWNEAIEEYKEGVSEAKKEINAAAREIKKEAEKLNQ